MSNLLEKHINNIDNIDNNASKRQKDFKVLKTGKVKRRPDSRTAYSRKGRAEADYFDPKGKSYYVKQSIESREIAAQHASEVDVNEGLATYALKNIEDEDLPEKVEIDSQNSDKPDKSTLVWTTVGNPMDWGTSNANRLSSAENAVDEFDRLIEQLEQNNFSSEEERKTAIVRAKQLLPLVSSEHASSVSSNSGSYLTDGNLGLVEQLGRPEIRELNEKKSYPDFEPEEFPTGTGHIRVHRVK